MPRAKLEEIINNFWVEDFTQFFRLKTEAQGNFRPSEEKLSDYNDADFSDFIKLGQIEFSETEKLVVIGAKVAEDLSKRSGKKAQYEKGKRILRDRRYDAGIFIFYDAKGNFRFSLIYTNYLGRRRDWSTFRRFTYFVSKEFTNKTFLQRIGDGDFSSLEKIKGAFAVEPVTKSFYKDIANWYFWAVENVKFPEGAEKEKNGREVAVIRLITRLIFIWFMRERGLVLKILFDKQQLKNILKDLSDDKLTYYHAILQNLFFATLNTPKNQRRFTEDRKFNRGWNKDWRNHSVFRYQEDFKEPEKLKEYFDSIPFLNGGLFECLDRKEEGIIIDGFSRVKKNQPIVPNYLFFSNEREIDLNKIYGTKNKKYNVCGLINTLSSYNFTIDENTLDDQEVALDPELLGKVFENLLASFNPETATTARKATGSYYTPREIVDYMVTESLKAYFKTHLQDVKSIDEKLDSLFLTGSDENPFNKLKSKKLVELIESVRIVDPAVGSGAFPMGALNKMVFILNKVDPGNELWKQAQLVAAETIPDPQVRRATKNQIEEFFKDKNADYGRKLYLIQKCIYGVDIQQIAVEIAKLRFFISLLVDEKIDKTKENWGIEPLPNLDFKIMQGNSLIELISYTSTNDQKRNEMINQQKKLKDELFSITSPEEKKKRRDEIDNVIRQLFEYDRNLIIDDLRQKIKGIQNQGRLFTDAKFETEDKKRIEELEDKVEEVQKIKIPGHSEHFEWHINFSEVFQEKDGFDVVIANPPYIDSESMVKEGQGDIREAIQKTYAFTKGNWDIYIAFLELALKTINNLGALVFITPDKWISKSFGDELRKNTIKNIYLIVRAGREVFESSKVDSIISFFSKRQSQKLKILEVKDKAFIEKREIDKKAIMEPFALDWLFSDHLELLMKINLIPMKASSLGECENACATSDAYKLEPIIKNSDVFDKKSQLKIINTGTIGKYYSKWGKQEMTYLGHKYLNPVIQKEKFFSLFKNSYAKKSIQPKIILKGLNLLDACLDIDGDTIPGKSTLIVTGENINDLKLLLALINSKLIYFYLKERFVASSYNQGVSFTKEMINNLPVPKITEKDRNLIIKIVDNIIIIKKFGDYLENQAQQKKAKEYEKQIDQMVYKLYGLTKEEIKIIENQTK